MWHLAQINVGRLLAPLDDPKMAAFVAQLDTINRLAEDTPGFVWRLTAPDGAPSSYIRLAGEDERSAVNMSVWTSIDALLEYTYRSNHAAVYRDRRLWFEPLTTPAFVLWWIPAGHIPTVAEGNARLDLLTRLGPTAEAFTFKQRFPHP